jgi:lipopolysaccharide transport system permease protein
MRELWEARELMWSFTVRELSIRYKQTFLGVLWAVIQPLSQMVVFSIVFGRVAHLPTDGLPLPLFYYVGLLPWALFSAALNQAIPSLASNNDLITKVYFPRLVLPLSSILVAGADFLVSCVLFGGIVFWYRDQVHFTLKMLYVFPLLAILICFTAGVCVFFSGLNVFYRDIRYALPLVLQLWIYAVPVIYSADKVTERYPQYRWLYMADPVAVVVDGFRRCLVKGTAPLPSDLIIGSVSAVVVLALSVRYFGWVDKSFADIV